MIPEFGLGDVLPPFMGEDVVGAYLPRSPYSTTISELVLHFATSPQRCVILKGFLSFREALRNAGFTSGIQWLDGSFVENCEVVKGRSPGDIDIVSLLRRPAGILDEDRWTDFVEKNTETIFDASATKRDFHCDAYFIDLDVEPQLVAESVAYWFGLFSHQRETFRWKGIVQLNFLCDDDLAANILETREKGW
jgi:hypothetical protein